MEYSVVELGPDDWERYKEIRLEALEYDPQAFGSSLDREKAFDEARWRSRLQPYSLDHMQWSVFAEDKSGKLIASAGAYVPEDGIAEIVGVYVTESARGLGLASILMQEVLSRIRRSGEIQSVRLTVNEEQSAAVGLYRKLGFVTTGDKKETLGGQDKVVLIMELKL
ncbi:MAG: GNAT family N-acetyltransferase [Candidatus Dojkabacteria bacterium]|nr:GNAT family N-acetyltransferase [Candidatus Dojkabacteria bacterium]